jgi:hypothetical protein
MSWRDTIKKEAESNSSRIWGRLLQATTTARQKVAEKYYEVREGGNGAPLLAFMCSYAALESDDDTPDNTHTQRVLAQYYLSTEGALPSWLPPPASLTTGTSSSHRPSQSNSGGSGSPMYRAGSKPVSLQDIYDSAGTNQPATLQSRVARSQDFYTDDQGSSPGRQPLAGDRLRNKLRPSNTRPSPRPGSDGDQLAEIPGSRQSGVYTGRSGLGGGDNYDPYNYNYQQPGYDSNRSRDPRQGQYSGGLPSRPGARR